MNRDRSESQQDQQAVAFGNRLIKNARHRRKWARREGVRCYRLYDRDIPEVPLCVDWYECAGGEVYLHIAHYPELDRERLPGWLEAMVGEVSSRLEVDAGNLHVKTRRRTSGDDQYQRVGDGGQRVEVEEGAYRFLVNLADYLDSGLFLDHRITRAMVGARSRGARFLNLFSYTGAFTVYAAGGGASETVSVDMSRTYSTWAADNLTLNGKDPGSDRHRIISADVFAFLTEARARHERFDLVVVDPPIFSNSKRMDGSFDVQRDHVGLLLDVHALCRAGAEVFFSTSRRKFRFEDERVSALGYDVEEITAATIPVDFQHRRPHRCWRLRAGS